MKPVNIDIIDTTSILASINHISSKHGLHPADLLYALSVMASLPEERKGWWSTALDCLADDDCSDELIQSLILNHDMYYSDKQCPVVVKQMYDRIVAIRDSRIAVLDMIRVRPSEVNLRSFMNTIFQKSEVETVICNLVVCQLKVNPDYWTPFSIDDYKSLCNHDVSNKEIHTIEALCEGGRVCYGFSHSDIKGGYLSYDASTRKYSFTNKLLDLLAGYKYKHESTNR